MNSSLDQLTAGLPRAFGGNRQQQNFRGRGWGTPPPQGAGQQPKFGKGSNAGKIHQRILVPARAIGCLIGKSGNRLKELKERTGAMMIIKGHVEPERLVTAIGDMDTVAHTIEVMAEFMLQDFGDRTDAAKSGQKLPKIMESSTFFIVVKLTRF